MREAIKTWVIDQITSVRCIQRKDRQSGLSHDHSAEGDPEVSRFSCLDSVQYEVQVVVDAPSVAVISETWRPEPPRLPLVVRFLRRPQ